MCKKFYIVVFALVFFSCNQRKESEANTNLLYFDIKGYFGKEINRLQKLTPTVKKTVSVNGAVEDKSIKINDWNKELAIFVDADINKTSWKGSFNSSKTDTTENFISTNKKIPVKNISIQRKGNQVLKLEIIIANQNILYSSNDTLTYYPDSLYQIKKQQKIELLKVKNYQISGRFLKK